MATQRADAAGRWKPLHAFARALLLPFQRSFAFACLCLFATFGVRAACCRAGCCAASLASLLPLAFLPGLDSSETSLFLNFVERRGRSARVRTMPRGIDQALVLRLASEPGWEIVPALTTERARELAFRTLELRIVLL